MRIGFIGSFNQPNMVGEVSDETHLAREMEKSGHEVYRIPRDEWREYVIENFPKDKYKVPEDIKLDIVICAKWHHFYDGSFINKAREKYECPVFLWVWDFMGPDFPDWHIQMARSADLYLSGEMGLFSKYKELGVKPYYFQMDCCDGDIPIFKNEEKKYDVIFTGSYYQDGHRLEWLKEINKQVKVIVFGFGYEDWIKNGFEAYPPVYGSDYNKVIAQSKIVLGFGYTIPCWGYWSNRVGKVLTAKGYLLQEYVPGMEQLLPEGLEYFSSPEEAIEKIKYTLASESHRLSCIALNSISLKDFTSKWKMIELEKLIERYLKGGSKWNTV